MNAKFPQTALVIAAAVALSVTGCAKKTRSNPGNQTGNAKVEQPAKVETPKTASMILAETVPGIVKGAYLNDGSHYDCDIRKNESREISSLEISEIAQISNEVIKALLNVGVKRLDKDGNVVMKDGKEDYLSQIEVAEMFQSKVTWYLTEPKSEEKVVEETEEEATAEEATTEEATAEEATAEEATAEEATAEEVTAEEATAEEVTAEEATAEEVTAEEVTAEEATAEEVTAEEVTAPKVTVVKTPYTVREAYLNALDDLGIKAHPDSLHIVPASSTSNIDSRIMEVRGTLETAVDVADALEVLENETLMNKVQTENELRAKEEALEQKAKAKAEALEAAKQEQEAELNAAKEKFEAEKKAAQEAFEIAMKEREAALDAKAKAQEIALAEKTAEANAELAKREQELAEKEAKLKEAAQNVLKTSGAEPEVKEATVEEVRESADAAPEATTVEVTTVEITKVTPAATETTEAVEAPAKKAEATEAGAEEAEATEAGAEEAEATEAGAEEAKKKVMEI